MHRGADYLAGTRSVVLVEGDSDRNAFEALAARRSIGLEDLGVSVIAMGGVTNLGAHLDALRSRRGEIVISGLYDAGEETFVRKALQTHGLGPCPDREALESHGFFVCDGDLEDELIRALGTSRVRTVIEVQGEGDSFRRFQAQPAQRERATDDQLHRFIGTRSGRKVRYGRLLVEALDLDRVPRPLDSLLQRVVDRG